MYSYIMNTTNSEAHFNKIYDLTELKSDLLKENHKDSIQHAYRIKDLTEAINTSVLIDVDKKEQYNEWLTSETAQFDATNEFVSICKEVGECDIY